MASKGKKSAHSAAKSRPSPKSAPAASKKSSGPSKPAKKLPAKAVPKPPSKPAAKAPAKPAPKSSGKKAAPEPVEAAGAIPLRGDGRRHILSLSFLRDGDEFMARLETDAGQITELKNRSLDQLLTLVAGELEDLLE